MNVALSSEENEGFKSYVRQFEALGLHKDSSSTVTSSSSSSSSSKQGQDQASSSNASHRYVDESAAKKYTTSPNAKGGIACELAGQVWPAKFVFGLADIVTGERKVNLQTRTMVTQVKRHWLPQESNEVITDRGNIVCEHVVYATNGYTAYLLPELRRTIVPTQGQVLVTAPLKLSIPGNTWYDYGYLYMIQRPNGRLVLGGCRNKHPKGESPMIDDSQLEPIVSKALRDFLRTNFPEAKEGNDVVVEHEWTGIMGFTPDYLPMIGQLRGKQWIAAGYTGYGMPKCFGAGKAVAEMITGKLTQSEFVPQYSPARYYPVAKL
jgi:glycine/D-amino acid oxidase-like deaminating enzyme